MDVLAKISYSDDAVRWKAALFNDKGTDPFIGNIRHKFKYAI